VDEADQHLVPTAAKALLHDAVFPDVEVLEIAHVRVLQAYEFISGVANLKQLRSLSLLPFFDFTSDVHEQVRSSAASPLRCIMKNQIST
jgi:hypothetical protein